MACPKHITNCPDRQGKSGGFKSSSINPQKPLEPTKTTINGKTYIVTPKK